LRALLSVGARRPDAMFAAGPRMFLQRIGEGANRRGICAFKRSLSVHVSTLALLRGRVFLSSR
jgi:hypothetical protein